MSLHGILYVCILVIFLRRGIVLKEDYLFCCEHCQISASSEFKTDGATDILEAYKNPVPVYQSKMSEDNYKTQFFFF